jgi:ubiquinone/menaquinone biosynthesis C-methylase UbiE
VRIDLVLLKNFDQLKRRAAMLTGGTNREERCWWQAGGGRVMETHSMDRGRRFPEGAGLRTANSVRLGSALMVLAAIGCRTKAVAELPADAPSPAQSEWEKRDSWQRPAEVMDALGIRAGSAVADVGAGDGYFSFHLASRVGAQGKVYAEDISELQVKKIRDRAKKEGLSQIETILGTEDDPKLPPGTLDAILIVLAYHEMQNGDAMLSGMTRALKPGGLLAVIDDEGEPNQTRSSAAQEHKIPKKLVRADAARNNIHFVREEKGFEANQYSHLFFLIFEKPKR